MPVGEGEFLYVGREVKLMSDFNDEKHPGGRPLLFQSVEELESKIQQYFDDCDARKVKQLTKSGDIVEVNVKRPYTLSGLACYLDCSRQTLLNYAKDDKFFDTVSRARRKCENYAEEQLYEGNDRGAKFCLLNGYGWSDTQKLELTGADGGPVEVEVSSAELARRARELIGD